jgi:hypothetical protein
MNRVGDTLIHSGDNRCIVHRLVQAEVEFIVVGGLAVAWHCPSRSADDMDLLVNPTAENSVRVASVLDGLGLSGHTSSSFERLGVQVPLKSRQYAELLTPEKDGISFADTARDAVHGKLFNIPVRIAGVATLVAMKERAARAAEAQRDKHLRDIALLRQHTA